MKILTIIVTYNGMKWIDKCLSILRESTVKTDVIVIDNCSTDGTREHIPSHYPEVIWCPMDKNLGFGQGNNVGFRYAIKNNYDSVLLLNQDAYLQKEAIEKLSSADDGISLLVPMHMNGTGTALDYNFKHGSLLNSQNSFIDDLISKSVADKYEIGEVCAACWYMPIGLLNKIGGFNPLFEHYGEDNNYYQRLTLHGIKSYLVPSAQMWHDRIRQGNIVVFNKKVFERNVLLIFADPNKKGIISKTVDLLRVMHRYSNGIIASLRVIIKVLSKYPEILHSKRIERKKGLNWL